MIWRCLDSILVLAAFAAVYTLPPLIVLRRLMPSASASTRLVTSTALGLSTQALFGFLWNHLVHQSPAIEASLYYALWLLISLIFQLAPHSLSRRPTLPAAPFPTLLPVLLLLAIAVRSFDALAHFSLGQSDAYTHLQFLRDVVMHGEIRNIVYPPGYSWVLALPTMTLNLDAYVVARYAGSFFGVLLVGTLYLLGCRQDRNTGLLAAFLAAACPLFYPLIKTGMGAFANQMGLFLFPLALYLYLIEARLLFTCVLLGLTVSVPLFVFALALVLGVHQCLGCLSLTLSDRARHVSATTTQQPSLLLSSNALYGRRTITLLAVSFLLAFAVAGYHFLSPGKLHVTTTATLVTGIQTPSKKKAVAVSQPAPLMKRIVSNPAGKLAVDLFSVKRAGLGGPVMNTAIITLATLFSTILVVGFRRHRLALASDSPTSHETTMHNHDSAAFLILVGITGLLTTIQVGTGFLEFSLYQRSGWLLMESAALGGGFVLAWLYGMKKGHKLFRPFIFLGISASILLSLWMPPQHRPITSGAENELAAVLRELSTTRLTFLHIPAPHALEKTEAKPFLHRVAVAPDLAIISRRYTLFHADQGNLADVLLDPAAGIRQIPVTTDTLLTPPSNHFLCLIDRYSGLPDMGILERISPDLTQSLAGYQPLLYKPNERILAFLDSLPASDWTIEREEVGRNLTLLYVVRQSSPKGTR